ncbi:PilC/PilY family type IV pilus protein [Corallococcus sp. bb12-1]|uniref:DUF4114 domain-containing protein n=1 Tax=Corallococcus sp. bb12-1 TaxID=2996784 RepID=UPI0022708D9E|nr:DUF4114 domain-containing protein [Corallococcus sp. bb12-1]MCY1044372.1 PilC/PilY family type IV pilus protein [Corallococcus sp. bb12-1]
MRGMIRTFGTLGLLASLGASAQQDLCRNELDANKQPEFSAESLELTNPTMQLTDDQRLQLNTALAALNVENITLPFDQRVTISYVYESAGASHALGYMYMDKVRGAGYVDNNGKLLDTNSNGIYDLHEDIFNVAPTTGPKARPYVGRLADRRCNRPFTTSTVAGAPPPVSLTEPELAMGDCGTSTFLAQQNLTDARPGHDQDTIKVDLVGRNPTGNVSDNAATTTFSDRGLFPHIPNLLEPADDANANKGLGQMVFLLADDDAGYDVWRNLASPIKDSGEFGEGIPDYDVSKYDYRGIERQVNLDPGVTEYDRTVDLGEIKGNREIVFFIVVFYEQGHNIDAGNAYACLRQDDQGKCLLHLRTPISVFFSKAEWNMDQNLQGGSVVAQRNIGCNYEPGCNRDNPNATSSLSCPVENSSERLCGWLDGPKDEEGTTLWRLKTPFFGNLDMPMEKVSIPRPAGVRNPMPHVIVGAPTTDPFRWILGFEDLSGGGDRDFNDVVFVINKENGGLTRSSTVSGDISPTVAEDFTITKVRFRRQDDMAPAPRTCPGGPPCWTEEFPGACTPPGGPDASIDYFIAVDCRECSGGVCTRKEYPTWIPVEFPDETPPAQEVELDLLSLGFTGSQLCWKVEVSSPNERCRPIIDKVDVGYQAVRSGAFSRSSPSTLGNAIVWGVNETPGIAWGDNFPGAGLPAPSVRLYDGRKDYEVRGRLYFKSLYPPENPATLASEQRWEAGRVMAESFRNGTKSPDARKLYTTNASTSARVEVNTLISTSNTLFPDVLCDDVNDGVPVWDLNRDNKCGTPSMTGGRRNNTDTNDRKYLVDWLYGWEDKYAPGTSNVKRPWAMGGINLSTVALAVPPYKDSWYDNAKPVEQDKFLQNFITPLAQRRTVAYVGTMTGMLHAVDSGAFLNSTLDNCGTPEQYRGYFKPFSCSGDVPRDYGSGDELFAYMPYNLLSRYRHQYARFADSITQPRPSLDASPTIANVDLAGLAGSKPPWTPSMADKDKGAKTVLVSASGKTSPVVFSLDITDPTNARYPNPMWEFSMMETPMNDHFSSLLINPLGKRPDSSSSRFSPSVGRIRWGSDATKTEWAAIVGSDFVPASGRAGALYILDMKTGQPLNYNNSGVTGRYSGVITLETGVGVAAGPAMLDLDQDGTYDVVYVATTSGHVYRVNLDDVSTTRAPGAKVKTCRVVDAPLSLTKAKYNTFNQDQSYQQIHSNMALRVISKTDGAAVRFFFGTSDNPDLYSDGPPNKDTSYHYYLMAYEDSDPWGKNGCSSTVLEPMWANALDVGQTVWGGVVLSSSQIFATTAVGKSADVCGLSQTQNGKYYSAAQLGDGPNAPSMSSQAFAGHAVSAPVIHDGHMIFVTANGEAKDATGGAFNNGGEGTGEMRSRTLLWEPLPDGRMPKP